MAQIRQSRPDSGPGVRIKPPKSFSVVPGSLGSGRGGGGALEEAGVEPSAGNSSGRKSIVTSEYGTYKTVKARFWPWLSHKTP